MTETTTAPREHKSRPELRWPADRARNPPSRNPTPAQFCSAEASYYESEELQMSIMPEDGMDAPAYLQNSSTMVAAPQISTSTEEKKGKDKDTPSSDAHAAGSAESPAPSDIKTAKGKGAAKSRKVAKTHEADEAAEDAALAIPFVPKAIPQRDGSPRRIAPFLLDLDMDARPFIAPRKLGLTPKGEAKDVPAYLQNYEAEFEAAGNAAERTYAEIAAIARTQARELGIVQQQATARAQRALDEGLDLLDRALEKEREALEQGEREAVDRLALIADTARMLVRRAAASALGTVASRKAVIDGRMIDARAARDSILAQFDWYLGEVDCAGPNAVKAFKGLATDPKPAHFGAGGKHKANAGEGKSYSPEMENAQNEDLDPVVTHHATTRSGDYDIARGVFDNNLSKGRDQFMDAAKGALSPFQSYFDMLDRTAPKQIRSMRDKAIKAVDRMEKRARHTIQDNRNRNEIMLAERHAQSRLRFTEQSQAMAVAQNRNIQSGGTSQLKAFATLAAAQGTMIDGLHDRIAGQQAQGVEAFARYVQESSRRTTQRGRATARERLDIALSRARSMRGSMLGKAQQAADNQRQNARGIGVQFGQAATQSIAAMLQNALGQESAMRKSAEPVAKSVDSFRIPAREELEKLSNTLWERMALARQQADAVYYGGKSPPSPEPPPNASTANTPPEGTGSNPSDYVSKSDSYSGAPETEPKIDSMVQLIGTKVASDVTGKAGALKPQMTLTGQNPQETIAIVRGLTYLRGQAVIRVYDADTGSSLWDDIPFYMSFGNLITSPTTRIEGARAVQNYLMGNRGQGALHDLAVATNYTNDAEQMMEAMTQLDVIDIAALNNDKESAAMLDEIGNDLEDNQRKAFLLLRQANADNAKEMVAGARSLLLEDKVGDDLGSDPEKGADNAADSMTTAYGKAAGSRLEGASEYGLNKDYEVETSTERQARVDASWNETVARLGNSGEKRVDGAKGGLEWLDQQVAKKRTYWKIDYNPLGLIAPGIVPAAELKIWKAQIRPQQRTFLHNIAQYGANAPQTRASQLAVEDTRPGGAKRERFEKALYDSRLNLGMANPDDPKGAETMKAGEDYQKALKDEAAMLAWYDHYKTGQPVDQPRPAEAVRKDMAANIKANTDDERLGRLLERQVLYGPNDPKTAALAFEHAVDQVGTDEQLLKDTLGRMSRDQIKEAAEEYDRTHKPGLYERLGLFKHENDRFAELSGDDRLEIQVLAMGQPRNDRERAEVSRMTSRLQKENAGLLGRYLARSEYKQMGKSHDALIAALGIEKDKEAEAFDELGQLKAKGKTLGRFDEHGNFKPTSDMDAASFAMLMARNEKDAGNFRTVTDNIANAVSTAIVVAAAVVSTILTGGAAASIWIPALVTLAGGVVAMGANYLIKGGRYGYEDMGRDFGLAVVQAATAGLASAMTIGVTGGMTALRAAGSSLLVKGGMRAATLVEEALIASAAGAFSGAGTAMFDDKAWDSGEWLSGIGRGFERGGGSGLVSGLATGVATRGIGKIAGAVGKSRGTKEAAARGLAGTEAGEKMVAARTQAAQETFSAKLTSRALGGGIGSSASRAYEIAYDRHQGRYQGSSAGMWDEIGTAGAHGFLQSMAEGVGEHAFEDNKQLKAWRDARTVDLDAPRTAPSGQIAREDSARDGSEPPQVLRTDDAGAGGRTLTAANDNGPPTHHQVALSDGNMLTLPKFAEGSVLVHPDSRNLMAANDNFGRLINLDPTREVAVHHNPVTGEYVVIQGGVTTVATIRPGGEIKLEGRAPHLVTQNGVPEGGGYWIVHSHYHPNRPGQEGTAFIRRIPSGFDGDFGVLRYESIGLRQGERKSRIYFSDNGHVAYTDFGISPGHKDGPYWIDYPDPTTGQRVRQHFENDRQYADFVKQVKGSPQADLGGTASGSGGMQSADHDASATGPGIHPASDRPLAPETERPHPPVDRDRVAALATEIESLTDHRRALGFLADSGASETLLADARKWLGDLDGNAPSMVHGLGLVGGEPAAMKRLHALMNDTGLEPALRQAIADQVLEATRKDMVARGKLKEGELLMLLFHGAPIGRANNLANEGINLAKVGDGREDDFGRGLYLTSGIDTAEAYARKGDQPRGAVFPFFLTETQMGPHIDVRPNGQHRAEWEAFVRANFKDYKSSSINASSEEMQALFRSELDYRRNNPDAPRRDMLDDLPFARFNGELNRGEMFDRFREHLAISRKEPSLAEPNIVLGELGGPFTTGIGYGDQQAIRTKVIADEFNRQLGHHESAMEPPMLRTDDDAVPSTPAGKPADTPPPTAPAPTDPARLRIGASDPLDILREDHRQLILKARRDLADMPGIDPARLAAFDRFIASEINRVRQVYDAAAAHPFPLEAERKRAAQLESVETTQDRSMSREDYKKATRSRRAGRSTDTLDDFGMDMLEASAGTHDRSGMQEGVMSDPAKIRAREDADRARAVDAMRDQRGNTDATTLQTLIDLHPEKVRRILVAESDTMRAEAIDDLAKFLKNSGRTEAEIDAIRATIADLQYKEKVGKSKLGYGFNTERKWQMADSERPILDQRMADNPVPATIREAALLQTILNDPNAATSRIARRVHGDTAFNGQSDLIEQWTLYLISADKKGAKLSAKDFDAYLHYYMSSTQRPRLSELTAAHMLAAAAPEGSFPIQPDGQPLMVQKQFAEMGVEMLKTAIAVDPVTGQSSNNPWERGSDMVGYRRGDDHIVYGDDKAWRKTDSNGGKINEVSALTTSLADNFIADAQHFRDAIALIQASGKPVDPAHAAIPARLEKAAEEIQAAFPNGYTNSDADARKLAQIMIDNKIALVVTSAADRGITGLSKRLEEAGLFFVRSRKAEDM